MIKYVYELIGTFFLVFTVGMTSLIPNSAGIMAPIAIAAILAAMVYAGGAVSGGHYNPAVSFAIWIKGLLSTKDFIFYAVSQLIGGMLAASATLFFKGATTIQTMLRVDPTKAFFGEFLFTFALCYVVLNVAASKKNAGNSFFGLAIGLIVLVGAYTVGPFSGGVFNPAVALGITLMKISPSSALWVYVIANLAGAAAAAIIYCLSCCTKEETHLVEEAVRCCKEKL